MSDTDLRQTPAYQAEAARLLAAKDFGVGATVKHASKRVGGLLVRCMAAVAIVGVLSGVGYWITHQYNEYQWRSTHCNHLVSWETVLKSKRYNDLDQENKEIVSERYQERVEQCKFKIIG